MVRRAGLGQGAVEQAHAVFAVDLERAGVAVTEGGAGRDLVYVVHRQVMEAEHAQRFASSSRTVRGLREAI